MNESNEPDMTEEASAYAELNRLVQESYTNETASYRLALKHLLSSAGSTPATAARAITRFASKSRTSGSRKDWQALAARYEALAHSGPTIKEKALLGLLKRNAEEKKIVFVHHHETLDRLAQLAKQEAIPFARFEGAMSGPEKDASITRCWVVKSDDKRQVTSDKLKPSCSPLVTYYLSLFFYVSIFKQLSRFCRASAGV